MTDRRRFLAASTVIIITPGPDMTIIARNTIARGRGAGLWTTAGALAGVSVHVFAASLGLSAILASSAAAFTAVKVVGAAYLVTLGVRALWATRHGPSEGDEGILSAVTPAFSSQASAAAYSASEMRYSRWPFSSLTPAL